MVSNSQFTSHSPNSYSSSSRSSFSSSTSSNNYSPYSPCSSSNSLNYQHHTKPTNHLNSKSFGSLKPISIELTAPPSPPMIQVSSRDFVILYDSNSQLTIFNSLFRP